MISNVRCFINSAPAFEWLIAITFVSHKQAHTHVRCLIKIIRSVCIKITAFENICTWLWERCYMFYNMNLTCRVGHLKRNQKSTFQIIIFNSSFDTHCGIAVREMAQILTNEKSITVQLMTHCRQATGDYTSKCWPRYMPPYDVVKSPWVNNS